MNTSRRQLTMEARSIGVVHARPAGTNGILLAVFAILVTLSFEASAQEIGDFVWEDLNGNGVQDSSESGLAGADVRLLDCDNNQIAAMTTDANGRYMFEGLDVGNYTVRFVAPTGYDHSPPETASGGYDSNPDPTTGLSTCLPLADGQSRIGIDAGFVPVGGADGSGTGRIGDFVWEDLDGDGAQDWNEPGLPGADVRLLDCNNNQILATTTDSSGAYAFEELEVGTYQIRFIVPAGYEYSPRNGTNAGMDSNPNPTTGLSTCLPLADGQSRIGIDAGFVPGGGPGGTSSGSIGDRVWQDLDGDGHQEWPEAGFAGAPVRLLDCNDNVIATTTSDSNGQYLFEELDEGSYKIEFGAPDGFAFSPAKTSTAGKDSNPDPATGMSLCLFLATDQSRLGIDAGLVPFETAGLNVLLIAVDDLRPELGAYGAFAINTPSIDALAQEGIRFSRAYTQMATCSPSRTSLMTGLRPDTSGVRDLRTHFRDTVPGVVTLPQYFKNHGYHTEGICKVYHDGLDDPQSWSIPHKNAWGPGAPLGPDGKRLAYAAVDVPESSFADYKCADLAIDAIGASRDRPFFITVGFKKPHLPFLAPPAYFDMYDENAIPMAKNPYRAVDAPDVAFENWSELQAYSQIPPAGQSFDEELRRNLKHGYYASTTFVDAQVGRVLDALESAGLSDNTLVVFFSDHGFHLGEQDDWGKHTNFEVGTRVPLIIRDPGGATNQTTEALVELIDLYPTIIELAGLPVPNAQQRGGYPLEGDSVAEIIDSPSVASRRGAFSQWIRNGYFGNSIRTDAYRFTEWVRGDERLYELYDHTIDPDETVNVVADDQYSTIVEALKNALAAGGQAELPPELQ